MGEGAVVEVSGLSKRYRLGTSGGLGTLRDTVAAWTARRWHRERSTEETDLWALRDVSFSVGQGESLGIVGRNGAGKSTLLKILARITEPTAGRARLRGRVVSLLEVGTGFHPELTGRENVFLNGAILGMRRSEVRSRLDEIVAFAGVERFLDTPVKRFSSGMYVRLAFSVAAHLVQDILIVDEVLAVGDSAFQAKCLGRMSEATTNEGRTVLFVSHNLAAVERLCGRALLLEGGQLVAAGPSTEVIQRYLAGTDAARLEWVRDAPRPSHAHFVRMRLGGEGEGAAGIITTTTILDLSLSIQVTGRNPDLRMAIILHDSLGVAIFSSSPVDDGSPFPTEPGLHRYRVKSAKPLFMAQRYSVTASLYSRREAIDVLWHVMTFDVHDVASMANLGGDARMGVLQEHCQWVHSVD